MKEGSGHTSDWLQFEKVVDHVFDSWRRQSHTNRSRKVLQNHLSRDLWKSLLECGRHMAEITAHINKDCSVRTPSLGLSFNRVYVPTDCLILSMVTHVFVELASRLRVFHQPKKGG